MEHVNAALIDCKFSVLSTDPTGVTGLKGGLISSVYMHSSAPSAVNPNPAVGYVQVNLGDNFAGLYGVESSIVSPNSGASLLIASAGLSVGLVYTITIMGTTTQAAWHGLGVPAGVTAAVGVSFIAQATSALGTGAVQVPATAGSGVGKLELMGTPNLQLASSNPKQGAGYNPYLIFRFMAANTFAGSALATHNHNFIVKGSQAAAGTDAVSAKTVTIGKESATDVTNIGANSATAGGVVGISAGTPAGSISMGIATPADGSTVYLSMLLSNSSVLVGGW